MTYQIIIDGFGIAFEGTNEVLSKIIYERYVYYIRHRKISLIANEEIIAEFLPKHKEQS